MNEKKSIEKAREYFSCDRFATENGITLDELDEAHSLCPFMALKNSSLQGIKTLSAELWAGLFSRSPISPSRH